MSVPAMEKNTPQPPAAEESFSDDSIFIMNQRDSRGDWRFYKDVLLLALSRLLNEGLTSKAASLSYTSITSAVPLLAVVLALFTAFPIFNDFKFYLDEFLSRSLFPESISNQVLSYLNSFADAATRLTAIGTIFLFVTSILLMMTIEDALNQIFQIKKPRPLFQRILVFWAILSVGPFALALSLWASAMFLQQTMVAGFSFLKSLISFIVPVIFSGFLMSLFYLVVPNRRIKFRDAMVGGFFAAIIFEIMRNGFTLYLSYFPTYTLIYGAFAILPIFLIWVYMSWLVLLLGAYIVSLMPQIRRGVIAKDSHSGARLLLAIKVIRALNDTRQQQPGLSESQLMAMIPSNYLNIHNVLEALADLGYVMRGTDSKEGVWALVCSDQQSLKPLIDCFLFDKNMAQVLSDERIYAAVQKTIDNEDVPVSAIY
ncbi:YihY family inner membrane protein [Oligella urethralis]|uniref:YihY family inner membrane protein n=1 Tax=Oligella urethralis TaxID=90245 RepID=UPI00254B617B|nr:YihY family inner membrane protein [Oligella urethralis]MDK6202072.1 YihY family inner membrane protein [Oligella urethralis]